MLVDEIVEKIREMIKDNMEENKSSKADSKQYGGQHYKRKDGGEEHWTRMYRLFGPGYFIGCITKYVERYQDKNGIEDLKKANHFIEKLIELETEKLEREKQQEPAQRQEVRTIHYGFAGQVNGMPVCGSKEMNPLICVNPKGVKCAYCRSWLNTNKVGYAENELDRKVGGIEPCCECGEDYSREDLVLRNEIYCPICRVKPENQVKERK